MTVVFRLDAGPAHGLRHAARAAALAESGRDAGLECRFLVAGGGESWLAAQGWSASPVSAARTRESVDELIAKIGDAEAVVTDAPTMGAIEIARLRTALGRTPLVVIRDDADAFVDADVFCRFNTTAPLESPAVVPDARTIVGPRYAPIRGALTYGDHPSSSVPGGAVVLGAYPDPKRLERVVEALSETTTPCAWSVLCAGPPPDLPEGWSAVSDPIEAARTLAEAALVVTGGTWTAVEAAVCGVPALYVDDGERDRNEWRALEELGFGWRTRNGDPTEIALLAGRLLNDPTIRDAMAQVSRHTLDRRGGLRVWEKLTRYIGLRARIDILDS